MTRYTSGPKNDFNLLDMIIPKLETITMIFTDSQQYYAHAVLLIMLL